MNEESSNSTAIDLEHAEISQNEVAGVSHPKERKGAPVAATIKDAGAEGEAQTFRGNDDPVELRKNITRSQSSDKKVEILVTQNCRHKIGPKWYEFKAGQVYSVPDNVKQVLRRSGKLGVR